MGKSIGVTKNLRAFTLVELLVVLAIVGVLIGIMFKGYFYVINKRAYKQAKVEIGQEVEGVNTAREVWLKAQALGVDMPITEQTYQVLYTHREPRVAVTNLLHREARAE